jgi:hypothetical protein
MQDTKTTTTLKRRIEKLATVAVIMWCGIYLLLVSHAATPYASVEVESGKLTGTASEQSTSTASSGNDITFGATAVAPNTPLLGAEATTNSDASLAAAGFNEIVISADWNSFEPTEGVYSATTLASLQSEINTAIADGLSPSIDIGVQFAPPWIFTVGGGTRFVDQYGDIFTGSMGSGNDVPNAVTDSAVRTQLGDYISYLGTHLTGVASVRLGGSAYNELRYPSGAAGTEPNAYWFYDSSSQASLPASVAEWKPGTGTVVQATTFLQAYNSALVTYGIWLEQTAAAAFPSSTKLEMLLPGWGERPGEVTTVENNLLRATPDEVNQGLDWTDLLAQLPATNRIVAYTTWADSTNGNAGNPDPAAYIHSILPSGMLAGGEPTGNGTTSTTGMNLMFTDAKDWDWYVANWYFLGQPQTTAQVDAAYTNP